MKRGTLIVVAGSLALAIATLTGGRVEPAKANVPRGAAERPNIVVIETDDQTVESVRAMVNVRRFLARAGTTFENSFATFPLCCPSRATLLTGQYAHNHGVLGNSPPNGGYESYDPSSSLAVWLKRSGYATVLVGKYLNGYGLRGRRVVPPGWTEWYGAVKLAYFDHSINQNGRLVVYGEGPFAYQSDVYTRKAVDVIRRRAASKQPFFLWLNYFAPHVGGPPEVDDPVGLLTPSPAPRHRDRMALSLLPQTSAFNEADVSDKPAFIRGRPLLSPEQVAAVEELYRQRLESLLAVDEGVAAIVEELRRSGELANTLIVFTSDNGFLLGEHRVGTGKTLLYEPSIRVPLILRGPGVPEGVRMHQLVANIDVAPTILDAAGVAPGVAQDGYSLFPLLREPALEWGRDILLERGPGADGLGEPLSTAIRTPWFFYAEHANGDRELYDLRTDPEELQNLHGDRTYEPIEAELARRLAALEDCGGDACRVGPAVELSAKQAEPCPGKATELELVGEDERLVESVDFLVDGRAVGRDEEQPFRMLLERGALGETARVRALVVLVDGRRVTRDRTVAVC